MKLFHVTGNKNAEAILKEGFKEGFRGIRPGVRVRVTTLGFEFCVACISLS